jgi:hypothetical protein
MLGRLVLPLSLAVSTLATVQVLAPGPDYWWVADSTDLLIWDCHDPSALSTYTVFVSNPNVALLTDQTAIIDSLDNSVCSFDVPANQDVELKVGTGYILLLTDPLNSTNVIGQSQPFEVKAMGTPYSTVTPTVSFGTPTATGPASSTATNGTSSNSAASIPNVFASESGLWFKTAALIALVAIGMGTLA